MGRNSKSATFTSEFNAQFHRETEDLLRRRFLWFAATVMALGLAVMGGAIAAGLATGQIRFVRAPLESEPWLAAQLVIGISLPVVEFIAYLSCFLHVLRTRPSSRSTLKISFGLVILDGSAELLSRSFAPAVLPWSHAGMFEITVIHVLACTFLPWTPRQAIRPMAPLILLNAVLIVLGEALGRGAPGDWRWAALVIALSPAWALPGTVICWLRHSRRVDSFKLRFLQSRYGEIRRELGDARRIHESLFPEQCTTGAVHFTFRYRPMRQIGGDFLHVHRSGGDNDPMSLVLMDVTGHGIPAALTVNRLHGELERIFAESPRAEPGDVLSLLNRYVFLTLANHSVYVTALCLRIDPLADRLTYASGGHPPAFLKTVDGRVEDLESTTFVLGAIDDPSFAPEPDERAFGVGDVLIAYTDGAFEARDGGGRQLGIQSLRAMVFEQDPHPDGGWPETIIRSVERHRRGPPEDDTLVIEVSRPLLTSRSSDVRNAMMQSVGTGAQPRSAPIGERRP